MKFFLVNNETEAAKSMMEKMAERAGPNAIIPCTKEELRSFNEDFQLIHMGESAECPLVEVERGKQYILFADKDTNIGDVVETRESQDLTLSIIRTS